MACSSVASVIEACVNRPGHSERSRFGNVAFSLLVPVFNTPPASGSRLRAANVSLAPLPYFPGPRQFYPQLLTMRSRLRAWVDQCDVIHLRVPSPAAIFAFRIAEARRKPIFLLVVGDYEALLPHLGYRGIKKILFAQYVAFEEWALHYMTKRALTFANGAALKAKHERDGVRIHETRTTTLSLADLATRTDTCAGQRIRLLCVSRIDPRKGLRSLPEVIRGLVSAKRYSLANSAGIALGARYHADLTRPGLALYGGIPRPELADAIRQVAYPEAAVLQVRELLAGDAVGYNATFVAPRPMRVGVVALGYADGYLRCWSGKGRFHRRGAELPALGRVSMDMTVVDLSAAPDCGEGDWVTADYDPVASAAATGLSQYELFTLLGKRFGRG